MAIGQRQKKYWLATAVTFACVVAIGVLCATILNWSGHRWSAGPTIVLLSLVSALALAAVLPWWRAIDEMQQKAQLSAWYWGGSFGTGVGMLSALVLGGPRSPMVQGAILVAAAQVAFYALFWVAWKMWHRPRTS